MAITTSNPVPRVFFSDVNPDVVVSSPYELVYDEEAIKKSILTILGTRRGTRPFRRNFGSDMMDILFDPMDDFTGERIKSSIVDAIQEWEPRVTLKTSSVIPDFNRQLYYVQLDFIIPELNNKSVSFSFNLATQG